MKRIFLILGIFGIFLSINCAGPSVGTQTCKTDADCPNGLCQDGLCRGGCKVDSDCSAGGVCNNGVCSASGCTAGEACPNGQICQGGRCSPCKDDAACGAGKLCISGRCTAGDCRGPKDTSCPDGKICKDNQCTACSDDQECTNGPCIQGACIPGGCRNSGDCSDGKICKDGKCVGCAEDKDCAAGQICIDGACKAGDCKGDSDCKDGKVCKDNVCSGCTAGSCPKGQICDSTTARCRPGCNQDSDCQSGQKCDPTDKTCKGCVEDKDCPTGQVCKENQCTGCANNADCKDGKVCINGLCQDGCRNNSGCTDGKVCKDGKCIDCTSDAECQSGGNFVCDPKTNRCRRGCRANSDCPSGKYCDTNNASCVDCLLDEHCVGGQICKNNTCASCTEDKDCGSGKVCDDTSKLCRAGCRKDSDCPNNEQCDPKAFTCHECVDSSHCANGKVCKNNACSDCTADADCPGGKHCDTQKKTCEECVTTSHCTEGKVCTNSACTSCQKDAECGTGRLCNPNTGRCSAGDCRDQSGCTGTNICVNTFCVACPALSIQIRGTSESIDKKDFQFKVFITNGSLPTPTTWKLTNGPTWLKLTKANDFEADIAGTQPPAGTHTATVEVSVGGCKITRTLNIKIWSPLTSLVTKYITGAANTNVVDLGNTIQGGKPPYRCSLATVRGRGSVPAGVALGSNTTNIASKGCPLTGAPNNTNAPGSYGFLVRVEDDLGQFVYIPVAYQNGTCNNASFDISPSVDQVPVVTTGSAFQWTMKVKDMQHDSNCSFSINLFLSLGPLGTNANLSCTGPEPVCVECNSTQQFCISGGATCQENLSSTQILKVKAHSAIRPADPKGPAFQSFEPEYSYSNNKKATCHWDVLERD